MAESAGAPVLTGKYVSLRPIFASDYEFLYDLLLGEENGYRYRFRGATPSPEQFVQHLWQAVLAQYVVVDTTGEPVGLVSSYGYDANAAYVRLAVALAPRAAGRGWAMESAVLFIQYLFDLWSLRKIYMDVPEFNFTALSSGVGVYFTVEGQLVGHDYYQGRYWDEYILAVTREQWSTSSEKLRRDLGHQT